MRTILNALFLGLLAIVCSQVSAQNSSIFRLESSQKSPASDKTEAEEVAIREQLDDFDKAYRFKQPTTTLYDSLLLNTHGFKPGEVPRYSPEVYRKRLYEIPAVIPMDYNEYVQRYIQVYGFQKRDQVSRMLGLSRVYFPIYEETFDRMGLPMELKYLSLVESALNPHARSRVGATGLWQFMLATGRLYGLDVNSFVDERKDPYKSTEAAAQYLKNAYDEFDDWLLAIASYNCGAGNVRKAIRRSGGKQNFWEIRQYLPRETAGYVPAFIAATYIFHYASAHNIYPTYVDFTMEVDTLHLHQLDITLEELAKETGADLDELRALNPELKLDRVPYTSHRYVLRVPAQVGDRFAAKQREIVAQYGQKRDQVHPSQQASPVLLASNSGSSRGSNSRSAAPAPETYSPKPGETLVYYTVRSGDVVGAIAEKYQVSPRQIAAWNDLRRYRISLGQKLKIYTTPEVARQAGARPRSTLASQPSTASLAGPVLYHTVKRNETLWGIANKYDGVTVETILALNKGLRPSDLKTGQSIRIR